jgi:hypothetical protein
MFRLARHVNPSLTVGDCFARRWTLVLNCDGCGRRGDRLLRRVPDKLPAAATMAQIAERARCSACGSDAGELATMNWRAGD